MKSNHLKLSILPLLVVGLISATTLSIPGQGKSDDKDRGKGRGNDKHEKYENRGKGKYKEKDDDRKYKNDRDDDNDEYRGRRDDDDDDRGKSRGKKWKSKDKQYKKWAGKVKGGDYERVIGRRTDVDWDFGDDKEWKRPKDYKKVTVCHKPNGRDANPVNIRISENALKAHLNHGDNVGECNFDYSNWPKNYISSRENVYNTYEDTYENLSYSEALIQYALQRILGVRTDLDANRSNYTANEIQKRDEKIRDLQYKIDALQRQQDLTRQQLNTGTNLIVQL